MLSITQIKEGLNYLGITERGTILDILNARDENYIWEEEQKEIARTKEGYEDRFKVPQGGTQKFYTILNKETTGIVNDLKQFVRQNPQSLFIPSELSGYIEKNKTIKSVLKFHGKFGNNKGNLEKAKLYPINKIIELRGGFAKRCIWHSPDKDQITPSLKYYPKSNTVYCFSCAEKHDVLDVAMKMYNLTLPEAINKLST